MMNLYIVNSRWLDLYISTRWIGLGVCISPKHKTFHINILILRMTLYFGGK
jgi:hypothetical protein